MNIQTKPLWNTQNKAVMNVLVHTLFVMTLYSSSIAAMAIYSSCNADSIPLIVDVVDLPEVCLRLTCLRFLLFMLDCTSRLRFCCCSTYDKVHGRNMSFR
jgi:hypothetical protein